MPTQTFYILGAVHNIVNIDYKKKSEAEIASFDDLIIKEACAVMNRLEKGKGVPGLASLDCHCLFCHQYLLPH
ncbi:hypothetical protein RirG_199430 [Rhizophagus irregularis DAOM 197198w]|uniref:Uncharacterized protein n=1 Tax=Rhizophagus irregularis (strain DAOM 197198w) TaxID=1432141 RepID=A0A015IVJ0_RHIIW|nr:hypothetical protein RirG_199430 [Rhizophagus irregularis DAOM 197198w]